MVRAFALGAMGRRTGTKSKTMMGSRSKRATPGWCGGRTEGRCQHVVRAFAHSAVGRRTGTKSKTMMGSRSKRATPGWCGGRTEGRWQHVVRAFAISLVVGRKVGGNTWLERSLSVLWSDGR